jgi:hypothetical protein
MQTMDPDDILKNVNQFASAHSIPSLTRIAKSWQAQQANRLSQQPLERDFDTAKVQLTHFWVDLRRCTFDVPPDRPPESAFPDSPPPKAKKRKKGGRMKRAVTKKK